MKKMNNKGFSLVELIVVVLIMAIIAVALAPQVMKWVENSRISTDATNYESMIENLQLAIADKEVYKVVSAITDGSGVTVTIDKTSTKIGTSDTPNTDTTCPTSADAAVNWGLTKIDASWNKIAKKASGTTGLAADEYTIQVTYGKQANVKRTANNPDKLKEGTDVS